MIYIYHNITDIYTNKKGTNLEKDGFRFKFDNLEIHHRRRPLDVSQR